MAKLIDKDAYGKGLKAWFGGRRNAKYTVWCNIAETERWKVGLFFREHDQMPELERIALDHCSGSILDAGAGAGSHALWLEKSGKSVTALDISEGACEVMRERGLKDVRQEDFFNLTTQERFDTILLLMNGIGIVQSVENFPRFFDKVRELLAEGGKVIVDSSNIMYLYQEEDGSALIDLNGDYYGELQYRIDFDQLQGEQFPWLFVDFETLSEYANEFGFECSKIYEDDHFLFLAELKLRG
ncbi:MAG: class I SAM-dependent methyltransferase [Bacteroidales bacterium]